jgi:TrpR family trp operon transcriptional repressor
MKGDDFEKFVKLCHNAKTPKLLSELFKLFLTLEEQEMIKSRYEIIKALLSEEISQRDLAKKYNVSIAQITRGSNALKPVSKELLQFLHKEFF